METIDGNHIVRKSSKTSKIFDEKEASNTNDKLGLKKGNDNWVETANQILKTGEFYKYNPSDGSKNINLIDYESYVQK